MWFQEIFLNWQVCHFLNELELAFAHLDFQHRLQHHSELYQHAQYRSYNHFLEKSHLTF